jgi:hypothetical protein
MDKKIYIFRMKKPLTDVLKGGMASISLKYIHNIITKYQLKTTHTQLIEVVKPKNFKT